MANRHTIHEFWCDNVYWIVVFDNDTKEIIEVREANLEGETEVDIEGFEDGWFTDLTESLKACLTGAWSKFYDR